VPILVTVDELLSDIRVLELTSGMAGAWAARSLADWGADVIKVEPPAGDPARRLGPFPEDDPDPERSPWFLFLNANKRGVTLDVTTPTGQQLLRQLLARCDLLIEDCSAAQANALNIPPDVLAAGFPGLVHLSVTPFGRNGPYADYQATDIVLQAIGGFMYLNGNPHLPPIYVPWEQAALYGGKVAAVSAMLAVTGQRATGEGQHVDVSLWEALVCEPPMSMAMYTYTGSIQKRGRGYHRRVMDGDLLECKDGWVALTCDGGHPWEMYSVLLDAPELLDERFGGLVGRIEHHRDLRAIVGPKLRERGKWDLFYQGMEDRIVLGPVQNIDEVLECSQLEARQFWKTTDHPVAGQFKLPGPGFQVEDHQPQARPAPLLGQHNSQVYCEELGVTNQELARLRQLRVT
jgi:crotonobetainyl-CoA:carnitine CoA-transferase CaiB-like acyl-CoA transferase